MSDELDQFRDLRPQVPGPTPQARQDALEQLRAAALREAKGGAQSERRGPRRSRRRLAPNVGLVISLAASVAVVIAVGAIALLPHARQGVGSRPGHGSSVRGQILGQGGSVLVDNRVSSLVEINPGKLPASGSARTAVYQRLAAILDTSTTATSCRIAGHGVQRLARLPCRVAQHQALTLRGAVTVAADPPLRVIHQIIQQAARLSGVSTRASHPRAYPRGNLAAQVLGTVGPVNPAELRGRDYPGASAQSVVGQTGLEAEYDRFLRAGDTLQTSLNERLQQTGQQALQHAISANRPAVGGAFVALNPENGAVYAMGSLPSFDPSIFTTPRLSQSRYRKLTSPQSDYPFLNRATDSAGPTGSTFKPITATAALQSGLWSPGATYDDIGKFCISIQCRQNAGGAANGVLDLATALKVSSDTFFYNLGAKTNADPSKFPNGGPLQQWAAKFGIGQKTGIDLPGELGGTLPTPRWRTARDKQELAYERKHHVPCCTLSDKRPWSIGDNVSLAVGQGDIQVTPLQLAVAYAGLANGGTIVRPHIGLNIENDAGTILQKLDTPPSRRIHIDQTSLDTIRAGLRAAASQPGGTSADVFHNFPQPVYGKAGTAQYAGQADYAWYAGYVPASATSKPITVVVAVQQGGFGDVSAAPVARQILSQWLLGKKGPWQPGRSKTL